MTMIYRTRNMLIHAVAIGFATIVASCSQGVKETTIEKVYPVEVETIKQTNRVKQIAYVGMVSSNLINYSFITGGVIEKIWVRKNQFVTQGTKLMQLESKVYTLALNAANRQEVQAKIAFKDASDYYDKMQGAHNLGGVSKVNLEQAKLDRDIKQETWEQAKIEVKAKQVELQQTTLVAHTDGVVSEIIPKVGELIGPGSETIIVKGTGTFVETAVSQKDLDLIELGMPVWIKIKDQNVKGRVSYISKIPDLQTFRHEVKIEFVDNQQSFTIWQTAHIAFQADTVSGAWVPINYISNDGSDFIYVVENDRMRKRKIQIIDFSTNLVRVNGLIANEKIIVSGAHNIKEGYKVNIVNNGK